MTNRTDQSWTNSGLDLLLELPADRGGLRARLEYSLRDAIHGGRLPSGSRLPPTRALARDLGVSRGTVVQVYSQLTAEGWLVARQGSGTVVAPHAHPEGEPAERREAPPQRWRFDLRAGRPDPSSFPRTEWLRALKRALAVAPDEALGYGTPQGQLALRTELAGYLRRARGLRVAAADLLITAGFTQSLGLLARILFATGVRWIAVEEPSMRLHRAILRAAGHQLLPIRVDEDGARIDELERAPDIGAVLLTPNRQHPTGATLTAQRRTRLLDWARATGATVIEDDYDGEFRYDRRPISPLQGLDPSIVVYAGSTSKTLAPGVRLGWLTLPQALRQPLLAEKERADWHTGALDQLALAELLRSSAYDRHIRKMRLHYRRRRDTLVQALATTTPHLHPTGATAGLNVLIPLPDPDTEGNALGAAGAAGIGLTGLTADGFYERDPQAGIIIGYAAVPEHAVLPAIAALSTALAAATG
jgi:GntR family transcriptional regulator/MocR family aminotransferase